ncbi:hypothetical protein Salmuc_05674 [Salipiger mucosus DSM 16094]|uniref:LPXTG cell wall anchor domain-containing protein n=1 Tax=Salipiger mucosus DSM 16094 TaxID=1123237 RepID=S9QE58_9RHOB|nr:hypothetical protein Salmuc_05674 [Salipiger mucosus DSM 16094]
MAGFTPGPLFKAPGSYFGANAPADGTLPAEPAPLEETGSGPGIYVLVALVLAFVAAILRIRRKRRRKRRSTRRQDRRIAKQENPPTYARHPRRRRKRRVYQGA